MTFDEVLSMMFNDVKHSHEMIRVRARKAKIDLANTIMKTIIRQHAVRCFYGRIDSSFR
ncbi:hypothetical protein SAMN03003324_00875 [Pedobacter antarcticus]|uniref:Uncharacterized protein n=1 Tax=Pedobacter antarcticus TaxID=34086 RepID=A0A1I2BGU2_9SPHI|nr:hypothetical protein [Pedobacter antarcticus]SFE55432.1 hypothetical protein SAMN03003324_00875 [Pedobacter antarcticus]